MTQPCQTTDQSCDPIRRQPLTLACICTGAQALQAAESVTPAVWRDAIDETVYAECQHFNSQVCPRL